MGSDEGEGEADERPRHQVTLSGFDLDLVEVTVEAYEQCVVQGRCAALEPGGAGACNAGVPGRQRHPVNCVTWDEADRFCRWAGKRLPTEAEWEYAARGADGRQYPWGNEAPSDARLRWSGRREVNGTAPVGSYPAGASAFGALDMAGNVWEWTADWYGPYGSGSITNPRGADQSQHRVLRGGGWGDADPSGVRAANRGWLEPANRDEGLGFRCARGGS